MATLPSRSPRAPAPPQRPLITTRLELYYPNDAARLLAQEAFPFQRRLRRYHVDYLRLLMQTGHFVQGSLLVFATTPQSGPVETRWLLDGYHRLLAMQEAALPCWFTVQEVRMATVEEAAARYRTIDRGLQRNWDDVYSADPTLIGEELPRTERNKLGAATTLLATGFQAARWTERGAMASLRDPERRLPLLHSWTPAMRMLQEHYKDAYWRLRGLLNYAPILSVALVTYRWQPVEAQTFWPVMAADTGLVAGQPTHTLLRFLRDNPLRVMDASSYARVVAEAWTAHFQGKRCLSLHRKPSTAPIVIAGTPHDGTAHKSYLLPDGTVVHTPVPLAGAEEAS